MKSKLFALVTLLAVASLPSQAASAYRVAVIVGNNSSYNDPDLRDLSFADDDAIKYAAMFGQMTDEVLLLTRPDADTRKLYPNVRAVEPTRGKVLGAIRHAVQKAETRARGEEVVVFFVYSGHGNFDAEGRGYVHLLDGRLTTRDLYYNLITPARDFYAVLLVDACNASFLVRSRGEEVERREAGPSTLELEKYENVGLILSASKIGEVKEWGKYLSGIFSHQVRSALTGVADADANGIITFQELAAFVEAANRNVKNPSLKLTPYIRPPLARPMFPLVDLKRYPFARRVIFEPKEPTRYTIYDGEMIRYADFNLNAGYRAAVGFPPGREFTIATQTWERNLPGDMSGAIELASLELSESSSLDSRGVDQYLQKNLFALPFSTAFAQSYLTSEYSRTLTVDRFVERPWYKNALGWTGVGLGAVGLGLGTAFYVKANNAETLAEETEWASEKDRYNDDIKTFGTIGLVSTIAGSAALVSGLLIFIFDDSKEAERISLEVGPGVSLAPAPNGVVLKSEF